MKVLTYFLPQFYATPENDKYWGKGFTDWNNVKSAVALYEGHNQPINPSKLGFYDLSDKTNFKSVCDYSLESGVDGFGYWHYWFGNGKQTLEKIQEMHLKDKSIKQNMFFAWANQDWTKSWVGDDTTVIFKQSYSEKSAFDHFAYIKPFIEDSRYLRKDNMPLFQVINPESKGCVKHILILEAEAVKLYGKGFFWIFPVNKSIEGLGGLNYARVGFAPGDVTVKDPLFRLKRIMQKKNWINKPVVMSRKKYLKLFTKTLKESFKKEGIYYPCILSGWDNTPRYKNKGFLIDGSISSLLESQLEILISQTKSYKKLDFIFIKAWNEWAEGNILEPYLNNEFNEAPAKIILDLKNKI
jgi:hypothetical protein